MSLSYPVLWDATVPVFHGSRGYSSARRVAFRLCRLKDKAMKAMAYNSLRILRDPTRGGVATTCMELIEKSDFGMELYESLLPVDSNVQTLCDLLGFDPLYLACEGRMLLYHE